MTQNDLGSLASSVRGVPRASNDADVITELQADHVAPFVARLQEAYSIDEGRVRAAVVSRRAGGETSDRQCSDIVGVLRTAWSGLDHEYLARWASAPAVDDLLERARSDVDPRRQ